LSDEGYRNEYTIEIAMPLGLIDIGQEFHICFEDIRSDTNIGSFEMEHSEKKSPKEFRFTL
jgi:hypothetical protein